MAGVAGPSLTQPPAVTSLDDDFRVLLCLIEGDSDVLQVKLSTNGNVLDLKDRIRERGFHVERDILAKDLVLRKVDINLHTQDEDSLSQLKVDNGFEKLVGWNPIKQYWPTQPARDRLHVFVEISVAVSGKRKRGPPTDITTTLIRIWAKPLLPPPDLEHLAPYIRRHLAEEVKMPLSEQIMRDMVTSQVEPRSMCTLDEMNQVFRPSEDEQADYIWTIVKPAIMLPSPESDSTEAAFISFWDRNIRELLCTAIASKPIRDSNESTSTDLQRPDFGQLLDGVCVFRGEENRTSFTGKHPRDELIDKLTWTYDPAPYILGYHAVGSMVVLAAITPSSVHDLVSVDLSFRSGRLELLRYLIKLFPVIVALRRLIGVRNTSELVPIIREATGTIIKVGSSAIEKKYTHDRGVDSVNHLRMIYDLLGSKGVQHVDRLMLFYLDDETHGSVVYLIPKGLDVSPRRTKEVLEAVICVLEALVVMHADPNPVFHRDIRWPNLVQDAGDRTKWILIDWDDAATAPTTAAAHLDPKSHHPNVFQDGHGAEVDIWAVGTLIVDAVVFTSDIPGAVTFTGQRMREGTLTAVQALVELCAVTL